MTEGVTHKPTTTDKLFRIAIAIKGLDGGLQVIGALVLAVTPPAVISGFAHSIVTRDLLGDQSGTLATHLSKAAADFTGGDTRVFAILYLLLHGIVKLALVIAMLKKILPAYPIAAVVLAGFVVYEVWRAIHTHSIALPFFAALDVVIIVLVLREYRQLRRERQETSAVE
ncbi:DUF2127 domain-containing protein [Labedaea rhizosphaerae]|uniref:Putative membrane protein n=1 Tax=Labedaea rhizosphaerae TaxID=598644 RepID=A0A4R6RQ99_LABRH|nr:DUF2127 domain-containing protein [Labedaea rhizosphaerae]TDP88959.1 putative membrane protein [Labedaea rhizosphaerae]